MRNEMEKNVSPIMRAVRKTVASWLESVPSFMTHDLGRSITVRDATYGYNLATLDFQDDHVIVLIYARHQPFSIPKRHEVPYSDPSLQSRVKSLVNSAYGANS